MSKDVPAHTLGSVICDRCKEACDLDDNFCRHCGLSLLERPSLPSVRSATRLPAIRPPSVPATVANGAAFVAVRKITELRGRRMARSVLRIGNTPRKHAPTGRVATREATSQAHGRSRHTARFRTFRYPR